MNDDSRERTGAGSPITDGLTRRRVLGKAATAGLAAAGIGALSTGATAQWFGGGISTGVSTFDIGEGLGTASELPNSNESELVIYLHGGGVGSSADSQGQDIQDGLADAGFDATVVAGVFEESEAGFGDATSGPGNHLAGLVEDYMDTGGTVHIVGWSMGGMITMQTLNALSEGYVVENGATFGTGTPNDDVCEGGTYHDGIANHAEEFCVITSEEDSAVAQVNGTEARCGGESGLATAPASLEQIDVTSDVDSHLGYLDSDLFYEELADCFSVSNPSDTGATTTTTSGSGLWVSSDSSGSSSSGGWW